MKHPIILGTIIVFLVLVTYITINYDPQIFSAIRALQNPVLGPIMLLITTIATLYIGVPIIMALIYFTKQKKVLWDLVTALIIGVLLTFFLKVIIARPRPEDVSNLGFLVSANFSSFPSDHASTAFIMFGILGHYFKKYKIWLYLLAVLIAFSRVYLGAHYPIDVLAGAYIGILVSQLVMKYRLGQRARNALRRRQ
jgi:undecaprenyl-diphosphatase